VCVCLVFLTEWNHTHTQMELNNIQPQTARPKHEQQHGYHHNTKVKPEAATAVVELLMMGMRMPETCWAVNRRQDNKTGEIVASSGWFIWIVWWCTDLQTLDSSHSSRLHSLATPHENIKSEKLSLIMTSSESAEIRNVII